MRRQLLQGLAAASIGLLLASCGSAPLGGPRTVHVSQADLLRALSEKFPVDRRVLEVFDIKVSSPRLKLMPQSNRIASEFDVSALDTVFARTPLKGVLALDYGLRFEPSDGTVRLAEVRIDRLLFDNVPAPLQNRLNRLGAVLGEQLLEDMVVHRVNPQRLETARSLGLVPGALRVVEDGIDLSLDKAPAR
jgi:hypothetical protein